MGYRPDPINEASPEDTLAYVTRELERIGHETMLPEPSIGVLFPRLHKEPARPREGLVVFADGTNWNPAAGGKGFYGYYNGIWNKLG
jgi:hypothetical protein